MSLFDFLRKWSGRLDQEEAAESALNPESATTGVDAPATKVPLSKTKYSPDPLARTEAILEHLALAVKDPTAQATRNWKLSRVVWRAGELCLPEALPYLAQLLPQPGSENPSLMRYCLLWALARCARYASEAQKSSVQPALRQLLDAAVDEQTYQVAVQFFGPSERAVYRETLLQKLPASFQHVIQGASNAMAPEVAEKLRLTLEDYLKNRPKSQFIFVEKLYALTTDFPFLRPAVYYFAQEAPFKSGYFKVLRHLYKMAEMCLDAELYGILSLRFAAVRHNFTAHPAGTRTYMELDGAWQSINQREELAKADSRLAFSNKTREWFIRRSMQTLLQSLEYTDHTFVKLATSLMLALDDEKHRSQLRWDSRYKYNPQTRRWDEIRTYYPQYGEYLSIFYLLYGASSRLKLHRNNTEWSISNDHYKDWEKAASNFALLPHTEHWDACPQAYIHLLVEGKAALVLEFALARFQAHPQYAELLQRFDQTLLSQLLKKKHRPTALFALDMLVKQFDPSQPNRVLVLELLNNPHVEIREQGYQWLQANLGSFVTDTQFVLQLLIHPSADIRRHTQSTMPQILDCLSASQQEVLLGRVLAYLLALDVDKPQAAAQPEAALLTNADSSVIALELTEALPNWAAAFLPHLSLTLLEQLLHHPLEVVSTMGARLIAQSPQDLPLLPDALLEFMLKSKLETIRTIGQDLLHTLNVEDILARRNLLSEQLSNKNAAVREVVQQALARGIAFNVEFAQATLGVCLKLLLRKEPFADLHEEILSFANTHLSTYYADIERKTIFRLLNSAQIGANKLAAQLIVQYVDAASLSVRNIVRFGEHEVLSVRQLCHRMFLENVERMRYEREDALRLLESEWEDTRAFAFSYFREHFGPREWSLEVLLSVCDSVLPAVQGFGREMVESYLQVEDGPEFLLRISQHPRPELQSYAAQYLEKYAPTQTLAIDRLLPYCSTVLSQVNKSRKAKDLVFGFLEKQASLSEATAQQVAQLLNRISLTTVQADKARCIELMRDLQTQYPEIETQLHQSMLTAN